MNGRVIIMGSGELAPGLVKAHRAGLRAAGADRATVLDTPYGFQENADELTDRISSFFATSLGVESDVATLRCDRSTAVDRARFLAAIRRATYVFAGPGSPSYALGIWRAVGGGEAFAEVVRRGGTLAFASAASLTLGRSTLPVYEIYKVGAKPHWLDGLDVLGRLGLECAVIPHWNNSEGGTHDTSRCYVGERRLGELETELETGIVGVDEHTAAVIDLAEGRLSVVGVGTVTLRGNDTHVLTAGESLSLDRVRKIIGSQRSAPPASPPVPEAGDFDGALAEGDAEGVLEALLDVEELSRTDPAARRRLRAMLVELVDSAESGLGGRRDAVEGYVEVLLDLRSDARDAGDFSAADSIRDKLDDLGVEVRDTRDGSTWLLAEPE